MKKTLLILAAAAAVLCLGVAHAAGVDLSSFISPDVGLALSAGAAGITKFVQDGDTLDLTPSADVASGVGFLFGANLFGVAAKDVANGVEGPFITEGVVTIGKTSALAISVGDRLFWDSTNKVVNKTATAQQCVGIAVEAAANPSATVKMKMVCVTPVGT
jgi:predicted RecA/RadA family phage recombinase